jgi:hypothetical protein
VTVRAMVGAVCRRARALVGQVSRVDWSADDGFAGGGEVLPFGVLIFVMGTLMVTNLWGVIDTKMATDGAAREGARLVAESDGPGADPSTLGVTAAAASLSAHGRDPLRGPLAYHVQYSGDRWAPCARATVTASYPLPLISIPLIGLSTGNVVTVASTHSEIIDPYRSRTADPGPGRC